MMMLKVMFLALAVGLAYRLRSSDSNDAHDAFSGISRVNIKLFNRYEYLNVKNGDNGLYVQMLRCVPSEMQSTNNYSRTNGFEFILKGDGLIRLGQDENMCIGMRSDDAYKYVAVVNCDGQNSTNFVLSQNATSASSLIRSVTERDECLRSPGWSSVQVEKCLNDTDQFKFTVHSSPTDNTARAFAPIFVMHGIFDDHRDCVPLCRFIQVKRPGTLCFPIHAGENLDVSWYDLWGAGKGNSVSQLMWQQVQDAIDFMRNTINNHKSAFRRGFNLVGHSQGGLIARVIISVWDTHFCKPLTLLSLSGPQEGVDGFADLEEKLNFKADDIRGDATWRFYTDHLFGNHFSFEEYWHDNSNHDDYVHASSFLALVNKEVTVTQCRDAPNVSSGCLPSHWNKNLTNSFTVQETEETCASTTETDCTKRDICTDRQFEWDCQIFRDNYACQRKMEKCTPRDLSANFDDVDLHFFGSDADETIVPWQSTIWQYHRQGCTTYGHAPYCDMVLETTPPFKRQPQIHVKPGMKHNFWKLDIETTEPTKHVDENDAHTYYGWYAKCLK